MNFCFTGKKTYRFVAALVLSILGSITLASAGTVTGTVTNGTTGKPASGVDMILIQLQGTMQPVANTKTDGSGHYSFDNPGLGTGPMLLRAVYRGVFYHEPIVPGKSTVDVQVFEPTDKSSAFAVTAHAIILQPQAAGLLIGEEFNISNKTSPPVAYYRQDGSFRFALPDGAKLGDVSAVSSSGMPVVQTAIDKGNNEDAIAYAFRPGDSGVRISYNVPYPGNKTTLKFSSPYNTARLAIFVPPTMQISADGFTPAGQDQGFNVFMKDSVNGGTPIQVAISGTAPPPTDNGAGPAGSQGSTSGGDATQDPSINSRAEQAPNTTATALPARLDSVKWIIVAGFAALFSLGLIYVWRRPEMLAGPNGTAAAVTSVAASAPIFSQAVEAPAPAAPPTSYAAVSPVPTMAEVENSVHGSLDALKESLFRLELRHQAGTINEEDYAREHSRIQSHLRDLVRG